MGGKTNAKRMFARCLKAMSPMRILCKARDLYVNAMLDCAGSMNWDAMGPPISSMTYLPRSSSLSSSRSGGDDEDLKELVRAVSQRQFDEKKLVQAVPLRQLHERDLVGAVRQRQLEEKVGGHYPFNGKLPGSRNSTGNFSLRIERIDEDKPCDFNEDHGLKESKVVFPRCESNNRHIRWVGI